MNTNDIEPFNEILLEEKPIVKIGEFDIRDPVKDIAKKITQMGTICLDFIVNNPVFSTFRIEIVPIDEQKNKWGYFLQVEPILWFEYLCHKFEKQHVLRIARKYVDEVRNNYIPPLPPHKSQEESVPSNTYCARHAECLFSPQTTTSVDSSKKNTSRQSTVTKKFHPFGVRQPRIFCAKNVPQKVRNDRFCNWYAEDERIVLEKDGWVAISQQENVREILVCPHPGKGYEKKMPEGVRPINHKNNKELAVDFNFWSWVFGTFVSSYLVKDICGNTESSPVELFALNFGTWEALEARDKQAKECHGHLHVHITRPTVIAFETKKVSAMYGKINNPKQYGIQNCMELETRYLTSSEISLIHTELSLIHTEINGVKNKVDSLETKVDSLETKVDKAVEKLDKIFDKLFPDTQ